MRRLATTTAWVLVSALLLVGGCQKLSIEKTVTVDAGEVNKTMIDPPSREQTVTVNASASGSSAAVYVVATKDAAAAESALMVGKAPAGSLGGVPTVEGEATINVTVPAGTGYTVLVGGSQKPATVKLRIQSK